MTGSFRSEVAAPMRASRRFKEWAVDSPGDLKRFNEYEAVIARGIRPAIPFMTTNFGKALVGAGKPWLPPAAPPPQPPPVQSSSVFAGRGCFTAHDPLVLVREGVADRFSWVALKADGDDRAIQADAAALLSVAPRVKLHVWEAIPGTGYGDAMTRLMATGYIGQAEGPMELTAAIARLTLGPKALVTNNFMAAVPAGWDVLAEAYWNVVEAASPGSVVSDSLNRGAKTAFPVFGVGGPWSEAYRVVPLADYVKAWSPTNWSVYLGEYLTPADIQYLRGLPRA